MKKLLVSLVIAQSALAQNESSDPKLERFSEIYQNYNQNVISDESWKQIVGDKVKQYQIQKGDTLWGISLTFFGDGFYWPKIWSLNKEITNPHLISPGNIINFASGSVFTAPGLSIEGEAKQTPLAAGEKKSESLSIDIDSTGPAKDIPPSLPAWSMGGIEDPTKDITSLPIKKVDTVYKNEFFIEENELKTIGEVIDIEAGGTLAGRNQYVYVKLSDSFSKELIALNSIQKIKNGEKITNIVQILGQLSLGDLVNKEQNIYRALVTDSVNGITKGALIQTGVMTEFSIAPQPVSTNILAKIVAFPETQQNTVSSFGGIVFIDAGTESGAQPGMVLPVYKKEETKNKDNQSLIRENLVEMGRIQIIQSTTHYSTAVIIKSKSEIRVGDSTSSTLTSIQ